MHTRVFAAAILLLAIGVAFYLICPLDLESYVGIEEHQSPEEQTFSILSGFLAYIGLIILTIGLGSKPTRVLPLVDRPRDNLRYHMDPTSDQSKTLKA